MNAIENDDDWEENNENLKRFVLQVYEVDPQKNENEE
jgi:hypothetical protein